MAKDDHKEGKIGKKRESLSAIQERAILALLSSANVKDAARAVKVSPRSIFGWLSDQVFQEAYRQARREATNVATARLQAAMGEAVETLKMIMGDGDASSASRVSAAKTVLEMGLKLSEHEDLVARIDAVEKRLAAKGVP